MAPKDDLNARVDLVISQTLDRQTFINEYWDCEPGEHVTCLGPNGSGKTYLLYQLLQKTASPNLPAVVLVMKPRDTTVTKWSKIVDFPIVRTWPPTFTSLRKRVSGYVLWPKHTRTDPDKDDVVLETQMKSALRYCYAKGNWITFADEVWGLARELHLDKDLIRIWRRGRSVNNGLWAASQSPTWIPREAYSQAIHLFLHNDPDEDVKKRYGEIGGVDVKLVTAVLDKLPHRHFLYIDRTGGDEGRPAMCVIGK